MKIGRRWKELEAKATGAKYAYPAFPIPMRNGHCTSVSLWGVLSSF
jgi:hypothetical protein